MSWVEKSNWIVDTIRRYREDNDGWKQVKKSKDNSVTVWWKQSPEWSGALYRSECLVDADPKTVFRYIEPQPDGPRSKWDKAVKSLQTIDTVDDRTSIVRTITHSAFGGLISSRDFTDVAVKVENEEFISTNAVGVDHPKCPPNSDHVRGRNHPCSIICFKIPSDPSKTKVVSYLQSDLGGMLPQSVVDNALPSNILDFYGSLKQKLKEDGLMMNGHGLQNGQS